jgi:hypothetical protein
MLSSPLDPISKQTEKRLTLYLEQLSGDLAHAPQAAGDLAPAPTVSSPTRATVTHAVAASCGSDRSRTPFQSDVTSVRNAPFGHDGRSASTKPSMPAATWASGASIASSSGVDWQRATRSAPSTTVPGSSSPRSCPGSKGDSSYRAKQVLRCASVGRRVRPRVLVSSAFPPSFSYGRISVE